MTVFVFLDSIRRINIYSCRRRRCPTSTALVRLLSDNYTSVNAPQCSMSVLDLTETCLPLHRPRHPRSSAAAVVVVLCTLLQYFDTVGTCKNRLPYNLYCVGGDVKHCTIQSNPLLCDRIRWTTFAHHPAALRHMSQDSAVLGPLYTVELFKIIASVRTCRMQTWCRYVTIGHRPRSNKILTLSPYFRAQAFH